MPVEVHIREDGPASVVEFVGALDSSLPAETRRDIVALIKPGCHVVFDLSGLDHLSGTGLRMLLLLIRAVQAVGGTVAGAGVPQDLRDIAAAAGFLELFQQAPSVVPPVMPSPPPVARVDIYPTHHQAGFALRPGVPLPFGATVLARGVNFAVYSRHASACTLVLFEPGVGAAPRGDPVPARVPHRRRVRHDGLRSRPRHLRVRLSPGRPVVPSGGPPLRSGDRSCSIPWPVRSAAATSGAPALDPSAPVPLPRPHHPGGLRLGRRSAAGTAHRGPGHLRDARPRLHAQPDVGRQVSRHLCRRAREDPVPEGARRQLRRAHAGLRIRRAGALAHEPRDGRAALQLLGL